MNNTKTMTGRISKRGFTLIELLIVIAIIGILAATLLVALGGARKTARDGRRISDLRNVQAALELWFNKCASYPHSASNNGTTNPCGSIPAADGTLVWGPPSNPPVAACTTAPCTVAALLLNGGLGINNMPRDPITSTLGPITVGSQEQQYSYAFRESAQRYILRARLETSNAALLDDIDATPVTGFDCEDDTTTPPKYFYCVGI